MRALDAPSVGVRARSGLPLPLASNPAAAAVALVGGVVVVVDQGAPSASFYRGRSVPSLCSWFLKTRVS